MKKFKLSLFIFGLLFNSIRICYAYDGDATENTPSAIAIIDFSRESEALSEFVKITPDSFKKAAVLGLLKYGWKITKITDEEVNGIIKDEYSAKIFLKNSARQNNQIRINIYTPNSRQNWADNIREEMVSVLVLLSNL